MRILPMRFIAGITISLSLSACCFGQSWTGILATSRAIDWSHSGLPATLPDSETTANPWTPPVRTQCATAACVTLSGSVTLANINAAISSASTGTYVLIPAGTYSLSGAITMKSGVTLRGTGASGVSLSGVTYTWGPSGVGSWSGAGLLTGTISKGGTSVTVATGQSVPTAGKMAALAQCMTNNAATDATYTDYTGGNWANFCGIGLKTGTSGTQSGGTAVFTGTFNPAPPAGHVIQAQTCSGTGWNVVWTVSASPAPTSSTFTATTGTAPSASTTTSCLLQDVTDPAGPWVCGGFSNCDDNGSRNETNPHFQGQIFWIPSGGVSGNTVTFADPIDSPLYSTTNSASIMWLSGSSMYGAGLEDLTTVGLTSPSGCYGCWIKGVRMIISGGGNMNLYDSHTVWINNYVVGNNGAGSLNTLQTGEENDTTSYDTDALWVNNIFYNAYLEEDGGNEAFVLAFNYFAGTETGGSDYSGEFPHNPGGQMFILREGNQNSNDWDDETWSARSFDTWFRNWDSCYDVPTGASTGPCIEVGAYSRFDNVIGNIVGSTQVGTAAYTTRLPLNSGGNDATGLTQDSAMVWGNFTYCTGDATHCQVSGGTFSSSDVPTNLSSFGANATPYENTVPSSHSLPASFYMNSMGFHPSGGTGLSWWKTCSSWTTFPTSCGTYYTAPFPPIGPDVTGGSSSALGYAYPIPAYTAWSNLPADSNYSNNIKQFDERAYTLDSAGATFSCSPNLVPANHSNHISLSCTGSGTSWTGSTVFTVSGVSGTSLVSYSNTSATAETVVITTGSTTGTLSVNDTTDSLSSNVTVATASLSETPTSGNTGTNVSLTFTGTNTLWTMETASTLFSVSGGSGASVSSISVINNTSATATLTVGSASGTLTIEDNSTTATASFTAGTITLPSVTTGTAGSVGTTGTTISGNSYSCTGTCSSVTSEGTCYATTTSPTTPCTSNGTSSPWNSPLSGLTPNTLYYFRAFAANSAGTAYGSTSTFTTSNCTTPTAVGSYTICGTGFSVNGSSSVTQSLNYTPIAGNGVLLFVTFCPVTTPTICGGFQSVTVALSDNVNSPETCFTASPNSPFSVSNSSVPDYIRLYAYYCPSIPAGVTQFTYTTSPATEFITLALTEVKSGQIASSNYFESVDSGTSSNNTPSLSASVPPSGSTVNQNDLITGMVTLCGGTLDITAGSGFTGLIVNPAANPGVLTEAMASLSSAGSTTATATWTGGSTSGNCNLSAAPSDTWYGMVVPLVGANQPPITVPSPMLILSGNSESTETGASK